MSLHGISRDAWKRYGAEGYRHWDIVAPGYKYNMFDLQAALVGSQFGKMETFYRRRAALKARLDSGLRDVPEIVLPAERVWANTRVTCARSSSDRDATADAAPITRSAGERRVGVHFRAVRLRLHADTFGFP
jgi:dTDP-4-amino-4,6-dideoxygalactose transaminase